MNCTWQKWTTMALAGLLVAGVTQSIATAQDDAKDEGRVVPIAPDLGHGDVPHQPLDRPGRLLTLPGFPGDIARQTHPLSPYYIGVAIAPVDDALRAHVDLPEGAGLLVQQVWEGSPAEDAGLEQYDIIVSADGTDLTEMGDLVEAVNNHAGDTMSQIGLNIIRHGQPQTVFVTPSERPEADVPVIPHAGALGGRNFNMPQMPGNVSVQVQKNGDGPAHIVVERNGEKWEIDGNDAEALKALPEDLRPMVEGMLNGDGNLQFRSFNMQPGMNPGAPMPEFNDMQRRMQEQMQQMQEQLKNLEQQLDNRAEDNDARA